MADLADSVARRYAVVRPHLSEFQCRLWLGAEAAELGAGGVGWWPRRPGWRPIPCGVAVRKPKLITSFESLIDPVTRGDPMSPLRWTSKSIRALTAALRDRGHRVSEFVVRRLLREQGYSLQANAKTTEGAQHADRDAQFAYLNDQAEDHLAGGDPVISVDTKKKERAPRSACHIPSSAGRNSEEYSWV